MTKHCRRSWISARAKCTAPSTPLPTSSRTTPRLPVIPLRFAATKLVEGDEPMCKALDLDERRHPHHRPHRRADGAAIWAPTGKRLWRICGTATSSSCAPQCVIKHQETREQLRSEKIDRLLTQQVSGHPDLPADHAADFLADLRRCSALLLQGLAQRLDRQLSPPALEALPGAQSGSHRGCIPSSSTASAPVWAAFFPSCPSSCCCSSSSPCWRTAAIWHGWPL